MQWDKGSIKVLGEFVAFYPPWDVPKQHLGTEKNFSLLNNMQS